MKRKSKTNIGVLDYFIHFKVRGASTASSEFQLLSLGKLFLQLALTKVFQLDQASGKQRLWQSTSRISDLSARPPS